MKKLVLIAFVVAMASCSTLQVSYDYDKSADFSKYKTYAYTNEALQLPVEQLSRDRFISGIDTQMAAKGFTKSDSPDIWVDLQVATQESVQANATSTGGGMYGGRYGYGGGFSSTQVDYTKITTGTLIINMIDKSTEKIVWQGRASQQLSDNSSAQQKDTNVTTAMKQVFANYPPK